MRKVVFVLLGVGLHLAVQPPTLRHSYGAEPWCYAIETLAVLLFLVYQNVPYFAPSAGLRLNAMMGGYILSVSGAIGLVLSSAMIVYEYSVGNYDGESLRAFIDVCACILTALVSVFNGLLRMMLLGRQLGLRLRLLAIIFWWVPLVNILLLIKISRKIRREYYVEQAKKELDEVRSERHICSTRYPVLLVHGVFFRDWQIFNYWGRIPAELRTNGCQIYYGHHQSAASVADSASELAEQILKILRQSGAGKVNIIAHSKGGLDSRYAISRLGMAPYVASLTTINTPHNGCLWGDNLLERLPRWIVKLVANRYNSLFKRLGDKSPDFYAAVCDLTHKRVGYLNDSCPDASEVFYQSAMSEMKRWSSSAFPLNLTYLLVRPVEGANDGLVATDGAWHGHRLPLICAPNKRGISHGDMIDLYRENIDQFDVCEYYVRLVADLKNRGF